MLWGVNEFILFFCAIAAFLVAQEIGFRLGRRHLRRYDATAKTHVTALQAALLGLLALLLGFNFAMAASRFEERKALIQEEVDAIRTTYLRAQFLPQPQRQEIIELLRAYVGARIDFSSAGDDQARIEAASANSSRLELQLWTLTNANITQDQNGWTKELFVQSLNDMINVNDKRRTALDNHVPEVVLHLMFIVAVGSLGFIAYGYGLTGRRYHGSTAVLALMIALVLTTIVDLDQPRSGIIHISQESLLRLKTMTEQSTP